MIHGSIGNGIQEDVKGVFRGDGGGEEGFCLAVNSIWKTVWNVGLWGSVMTPKMHGFSVLWPLLMHRIRLPRMICSRSPYRWCLISLVANVMLSMQAYRDDVSDFNKWWFKCNDIWVTESKRLRSTFPFDQKVRIHSVAFAVNVKCIFYQIVLVYMSMPEFLRILYHHSKQNALHGVYGKGKCAWREIAILKKIRLFLARR